MIELSISDVRRIRCWNQRLTRRAEKPAETMEQLLAIQTQYAMSLPLGILARTKNQPKNWIEKGLAPGKGLVKTWTIRGTLHTMPEDEYCLIHRALFCPEGAHRGESKHAKFLRRVEELYGIPKEETLRRESVMLELLKQAPRTRRELHDAVPEFKEMDNTGWGMDLYGLACQGLVSMTNHLGATTFAARPEPSCPLSSDEALQELALRYVEAYGPVTEKDFRYWTGHFASRTIPAFNAIREKLVAVDVSGNRDYFVANTMAIEASAAPKCRLLPKFDVLTMGHADKSAHIRADDIKKVSRAAAQVEAVILAKGEVIGVWRYKTGTKQVEFLVDVWREPRGNWFRPALHIEAERIAKFLGYSNLEITNQAI